MCLPLKIGFNFVGNRVKSRRGPSGITGTCENFKCQFTRFFWKKELNKKHLCLPVPQLAGIP